ncbi:MAG: DUF3656 domain-containing U32 family peptidase [Bacillota bacterium]
MKKVEILAPAGDYTKLKAAVIAGADAVYFAGKFFGARSFAKNFDKEEIKKAIEYCHLRDVNVYITVNTLIKQREIKKVLEYINFLYTNNVDAIIIQDIGLAKYVTEFFPDLDIHASTQMTAYSLADVLHLEKLGFSRVILSREVNFETLKYIKNNSNVELEVFVHGSLCMSYSGQCLMSSFIGGRSANRGKCAQPCRRIYKLKDLENNIYDQGYILSAKDLKTLKDIDKLKNIDISSLKIEGRMKSQEYVYEIIRAYKNDFKDKDLKKVFNRNYTKGFLFNKEIKDFTTKNTPSNKGKLLGKVISKESNYIKLELKDNLAIQDEIQIRKNNSSKGLRVKEIIFENNRVKKANKGNIVKVFWDKKIDVGDKVYKTYDVDYIKSIKKDINYSKSNIPINFFIKLFIGKKLKLTVIDNKNNVLKVKLDEKVEKAKTSPLNKNDLEKHLSKLGNTPYKLDTLEISGDENIFILISNLNKLRRKAISKLNKIRKNKYDRKKINLKLKDNNLKKKVDPKFIIKVSNLNQLRGVLNFKNQKMIKAIYYDDINTFIKAKEIDKLNKVFLKLNTITSFDELKKIDKNHPNLQKLLVSSLGQMEYFNNKKLHGDLNLNIFNNLTIKYLSEFINVLTLSPELNLDEIKNISINTDKKLSKIVYGKVPVMTTKYNFISKNDKNLYLENEYTDKYRLKYIKDDLLEIYSHRKINLIKKIDKLKSVNIDYYRLDFVFESRKKVKEILELFSKNVIK